jgi:hypothetical protein
MSRGYPDFLALPKFSNFGYLYRVYENWHTILAGDTHSPLSIAGQGKMVNGHIWIIADAEAWVNTVCRFIIDGVTLELPAISVLMDDQSFGNTDNFLRMTLFELFLGETDIDLTFSKDFSWGLSFELQLYNPDGFDIDVDTLFFYTKVETT